VNGEAIYATRPREGTNWSQGDTIRYTRSKDGRFVYAILTEWPKGPVTLESVRPDAGSKVSLLGTDATLPWTLDAARGTAINLPENLQQPESRPCEHAWTLKIETRQG
jgi:alpha-L-fucosidase